MQKRSSLRKCFLQHEKEEKRLKNSIRRKIQKLQRFWQYKTIEDINHFLQTDVGINFTRNLKNVFSLDIYNINLR